MSSCDEGAGTFPEATAKKALGPLQSSRKHCECNHGPGTGKIREVNQGQVRSAVGKQTHRY
jgi:hypothetical protein